MSVIGRLDQQVEEILISPLDKKRERPRESQAGADESHEEQAERASSTSQADRQGETEELPVWLL